MYWYCYDAYLIIKPTPSGPLLLHSVLRKRFHRKVEYFHGEFWNTRSMPGKPHLGDPWLETSPVSNCCRKMLLLSKLCPQLPVFLPCPPRSSTYTWALALMLTFKRTLRKFWNAPMIKINDVLSVKRTFHFLLSIFMFSHLQIRFVSPRRHSKTHKRH